MENHIIEDPFYGVNEHEMKWVYDSDWYYELEFDIVQKYLDYKNILLCFNGLDTIADIYLNGEILGSTENMFLRYTFDVKSKIQKTGNKILINFKSPTKKAQEDIEKFNIRLNTGYAAIPGVPYLRKAQYSFGWDWGPKLPDIGVWKSVQLVGYDEIKIASVYPYTKFKYNKDPLKLKDTYEIPTLEPTSVILFIEIDLASDIDDFSKLGYKVIVKICSPDNEVVSKEVPLRKKKEKIDFNIKNPILWWTHDLGVPNLYRIEILLEKGGIIDSVQQKIGLREIRLITEPDKWGETFYFLLNGIPVFAKGANWIPVDSSIPRGRKLGLYSMNLNYAKDANMNMIRVWGGGIYEDDLFYELCDELGILVWQDFPFACAFYYFYNEFTENVKQEVIQNLKRIRHHPSLALWCGNNEIEWLWNDLLKRHPIINNPDIITEFKNTYVAIFENLIPQLIKEFDSIHPYWPSSPSNGFIGNDLGKHNSNNPDRGDSHFWSVWHGGKPFKAYRKFNSRFMSEFGFESFPSTKTLKEFCPQDQFEFYSPIMENHQKNSAGNKKIMDYMEKRFSIPQQFEQQVILSQLTQAEAIEYGVEYWRQNRKNYHCMGSLYWQLNDCWPVASWASLDYFGRWKALHYFTKRFFQPIIASVKEDSDKIEFWVTNDLKISQDITFEWKILNSEGKLLVSGGNISNIAPCNSLMLDTVNMSSINKDKKHLHNFIIFYKLKDTSEERKMIFHGFRLFDAPKNFSLKNPEIFYTIKEIKSVNDEKLIFELSITTKKIALYVFIESELVDFIASDNFFSLEPNEKRLIFIKQVKVLNPNILIGEIIDSFKISSLYNLINL